MVARKPSKLDDFADFIEHAKFQPITSPFAIWQAMKAINDLWEKMGSLKPRDEPPPDEPSEPRLN